MNAPFRIDSGRLYFDTKPLAPVSGIAFAAGDNVTHYARRDVDAVVGLAPEPGGDMCFYARGEVTGIERKAVPNLRSSWATGELAEQMRVMLSYYDEVVLVVEGSIAPLYEDGQWWLEGVKYGAVMKSLYDWQTEGVRLVLTPDTESTASMVRGLHQKKVEGRRSEVYRTERHKGHRELEGFLWIDGVGPETARKLCERFKTVGVVATVPHEEIVATVGKAKAALVQKALWGRKEEAK